MCDGCNGSGKVRILDSFFNSLTESWVLNEGECDCPRCTQPLRVPEVTKGYVTYDEEGNNI